MFLLKRDFAKLLRKFHNNVLSGRAFLVLGPMVFAAYLAKVLINIPNILKCGDFRPLDKSMGRTAKQFRYRDSTFFFDCQFCDEHLNQDSFGFGVAREIYIRDCYFKWHPPSIFEGAKTVIDLGANRGAFSALMTTQANFILSVECIGEYVPIIHHNMNMNNYSSYAIETAFVGAGGLYADSNSHKLTIDNLFQRHNIEFVDLIKLDIEGSEFALFHSADWLKLVNAISMEVHPDLGDPNIIIKSINQHGFSYILADEDLQRVYDVMQASFIYAWKNT